MLKIFRRKSRDPAARLRSVIGATDLPTFPAIAMSALQKLREPDVSLAAVGDVVAGDPGLSVRLLRTVNSAAFALRQRVRSIHHAVSILGTNQTESLLISIAVRESLPTTPCRGFEAVRFWRAAAWRAAAAAALADLLHPSTRSESFTAALLEDMALPVLAHARAEEYGPLLEHWHHNDEDLAEMEQAAFGWNHGEVATWMCAEWKFPDVLAQAIGSHHQQLYDDTSPVPAVALVAPLREVEEAAGVERVVESAHALFALPRDHTAGILTASLVAAEEHARLLA